MADAGFFKGTSAEQDSRFANKQKKLLKQMKFPENVEVKIDMSKVNLDVMKPWITKRVQELLGVEDDVVIEYVFNQLDDKHPDPKMMQINLTGFLGGSKARLFISELWKFLTSAQTSADGIAAELVEMKKLEMLQRQEDDDRLREIRKREEETHRLDVKPDIVILDGKSNGRTQHSNNRGRRDRRRSPTPTKPEPKKFTGLPDRSKERKREEYDLLLIAEHDTKRARPPSSPPRSKASSRNKKSPVPPVHESKRSKKPAKRTRSSSRSRSSHSSSTSSDSQSDGKRKHRKKISSSSRSKKPEKKTDHRSRKRSPPQHRRKSHGDRLDKPPASKKPDRDEPSTANETHSHQSVPNVDIAPPSPEKPRLQSQIRVQTPPPASSKSSRKDRIVVLDEPRRVNPGSVFSRVSIMGRPAPADEHQANGSSEDEAEVDLRERLLREKAIKSMQRRQLSQNDG